MKWLVTFVFLLTIGTKAVAQLNATTEDGRRVVLNSNGTYDFLSQEVPHNKRQVFLFQGKKYISTEDFVSSIPISGHDEEIIFSVARDGDKGLIYLRVNGFFAKNMGWKLGRCLIFLENTKTISLLNRKFYSTINETISNVYYLTAAELTSLRSSNVYSIRVEILTPYDRELNEAKEFVTEEYQSSYYSDLSSSLQKRKFPGTALYIDSLFD